MEPDTAPVVLGLQLEPAGEVPDGDLEGGADAGADTVEGRAQEVPG